MNAIPKDDFEDALERVTTQKERVVLHRGGREVAVLVPPEDLALLEQIEDLLDNADADAALAEMKATGAQPIPIEVIKKRFGLAE